MSLEELERPRPKIYLLEVRSIIEIINNEGRDKNKDFLKQREKDLASMSEKKETLHHSQRMTNLGYLLAKKKNFSDEETKFFVEACLLHDIGKTEVARKHTARFSDKFSPKDLEAIKKHPRAGYSYLKHEGRSPHVYNPVLLHHLFQEKPYPKIGIEFQGMDDDVDIDNARLLAMIDVFDTLVFGRPYVKIFPLPLDRAEEKLKAQFNQPGDEEGINFLFSQYETIKGLS